MCNLGKISVGKCKTFQLTNVLVHNDLHVPVCFSRNVSLSHLSFKKHTTSICLSHLRCYNLVKTQKKGKTEKHEKLTQQQQHFDLNLIVNKFSKIYLEKSDNENNNGTQMELKLQMLFGAQV